MKRRLLIRKLESVGFVFERHGGEHDVYRRGNDLEQVPRHKEINEITALKILRKWNKNKCETTKNSKNSTTIGSEKI